MTGQIFMKFDMDVIFWTRNCLIIQLYLPGSANSTRTDESHWVLFFFNFNSNVFCYRQCNGGSKKLHTELH